MTATRNTLLLVEDSPDDEALSLRAIHKCGVPCTVRVSRHGADALATLRVFETPRPDLIVLDFHLPGLNGLEILRAIRQDEKTRRVPVVVLSSMGSDHDMEDCLDGGANSCVAKPMEPHAYVDQVALIVRYWLTVNKRPSWAPMD